MSLGIWVGEFIRGPKTSVWGRGCHISSLITGNKPMDGEIHTCQEHVQVTFHPLIERKGPLILFKLHLHIILMKIKHIPYK